MSTHAYIGRPTDNGSEGRYLHSDGYPTHALRVLKELVDKNGAETVAARIVDMGNWSTLEGAKSKFYSWHNNKGNVLVKGYGVTYREPDAELIDGEAVEEFQWAYILHPDRVAVLHDGNAVAMVRWDEITPRLIEKIEQDGDLVCKLVSR